MDNINSTWVEIDLDNLKHNINSIKNIIGKNTKLAGVVKANAYGHGAIEISKVLLEEGIDYLCTSSLVEALNLRNVYKNAHILIMGYIVPSGLELAIKSNITITIFSLKTAVYISNIAKKLNKIAIVHIKIDTGLNRLGFGDENNILEIIKRIYKLSNLYVEGIFSHLALRSKESDYKQLEKFTKVIKDLENNDIEIPIKHICSSNVMVKYKDFHLDMVRVGSSLYGYSSENVDLKEMITFKSRIGQIKNIKKGESVGYDFSFIAPIDTKIAVISCGYADGIPRLLSNKGFVIIDNTKCDLIGKICMNQCFADISKIKDVKANDEVIFYNDKESLLKIATICNTNRNEILTLIPSRVKRTYYINNH